MRDGLTRRRLRGRRRSIFGLGLCALAAAVAGLGCAASGLDARYRELETEFEAGEFPEPSTADNPFGDAATLERDELVSAVLERNPTLRAARQAWRAALARDPQVGAWEDPMLGYSVGPASFGSSDVDSSQRVELSQKLAFPGKLSLRREAALAEAEASKHDFEAARLRLAAMTSQLYDDYWLYARSLEISAQHAQLLEELRRIATARYEAGEASQQDPLQAESELAELEHRIVGLRAAQSVAAQQLNTLMHRPPRSGLPPAPAQLDPVREPADIELLGATYEGRPDLRAARVRLEAREADVRLARREFLPDFELVGGYDTFWEENDQRPFVGVALNLPLQLQRRRAALAEAEARRAQAQAERERLEDQIRLDVESSRELFEEAHHLFEIVRDRRIPATRDRVAAARAGFEAGRNGFPELIDAERALRSAELELAQATTDESRRATDLLRAVGRAPGVD